MTVFFFLMVNPQLASFDDVVDETNDVVISGLITCLVKSTTTLSGYVPLIYIYIYILKYIMFVFSLHNFISYFHCLFVSFL